jgi:hypothetical protein
MMKKQAVLYRPLLQNVMPCSALGVLGSLKEDRPPAIEVQNVLFVAYSMQVPMLQLSIQNATDETEQETQREKSWLLKEGEVAIPYSGVLS